MKLLRRDGPQVPFLAKLMVAFAVQAALLLAILFLVVNYTFTQALRAFQTQGGQLQARSLQGLIADYYAHHGGWQGIESIISPVGDRLGPDRDLILADLTGTIIASTHPGLQGLRLQERTFEFSIPIIVRGQQVGTLLIFSDPDSAKPLERAFLGQMQRWFLLGGLLAVGVAIVLSLLIARPLVRPLQRLTEAVQALPAQPWRPVEIQTRDEVGQLTRAFNEMAQRLERSEQARKHLLADLAHELRTPLAALQANLETLLDRGHAQSEEIATLYDRTLLLQRLIDDLYLLALAEVHELRLARQRREIAPLIEGVAAVFQPLLHERAITLTTSLEAGVHGWFDPQRIEQVLLNLLSNAERHTPEGGRIEITAKAAQGHLEVSVANTGEEIPPTELPHIFERFWRSPQREHGGLGLAIAKRIIEAHGGRIWATSAQGVTTFVFTLPSSA
jgi:two-component system OmpR family sensor kinase/two-component system sensor histidine kinase BaeS